MDACAPLATKVRCSRSNPGTRARDVTRRCRKGSRVTAAARTAMDACATLATTGRCERNNKNVEYQTLVSLVLRLLMTTQKEKYNAMGDRARGKHAKNNSLRVKGIEPLTFG